MPPPRFPPPESAPADAPLLVGGELTPDWLLDAYRQGIFPWPFTWGSREILAWHSPDPRAILELDSLHVPSRLARRLRNGEFEFTHNRAFGDVIRHCAAPRQPATGTWITGRMVEAYLRLHELGHAHSIEVWHSGELVGGLYGVAIGAYFAGESMFHRRRDASKAAVVHLVEHLKSCEFQLFDVQQPTPHLMQLGAVTIPRRDFLSRVRLAAALPVVFAARS